MRQQLHISLSSSFKCIQPSSLRAWILMSSTSWSACGVKKICIAFFPPKHPVWDNKRGRDDWEARRAHERLVQAKASTTVQRCERGTRTANHPHFVWSEASSCGCTSFVSRLRPIFSTHYEIPSRFAVTVHTLVICSIQTSPVLHLLTPIFPR